jgi:tripartite-type tricarboxylate transporter receptor subunit TctC
MNRRKFCTAAGAATLSITLPRVTFAQVKWPEKPIKLIVPFTPGGGTDFLSRLIADKIATATKWVFVVDNKPGATGNIGMAAVAKAPPDGYTIGMGQTANLAINPALYRKMPFDPLKDFAPIVLVASQPVVLVVRSDLPYKTLADLINAAKAKPDGVSMASAGSGTIGHLAGVLLGRQAGVQFLHVPYKGAGGAVADLLGGQVGFSFSTIPPVLSMLKAGKLRALAVSSAKRSSVLPDVPTVDESGYKGFVADSWYGLVAPAKTPAAIITSINTEVNKALGSKDFIEKLATEGSTPLGGSPEEFAAYLKAEYAKWGSLIREAGIKMD